MASSVKTAPVPSPTGSASPPEPRRDERRHRRSTGADRYAARLSVHERRSRRSGLWFALPAIALFVVFAGLPFLHSVYLSFFSWNGMPSTTCFISASAVADLPHPGSPYISSR